MSGCLALILAIIHLELSSYGKMLYLHNCATFGSKNITNYIRGSLWLQIQVKGITLYGHAAERHESNH